MLEDNPQNGVEGDIYGSDFFMLSMHMLLCSIFSLNILLSVALIIHFLVITVPISKY